MEKMTKIVSAGMFCAVLSWPIQGMAQTTQQEKDKIATARTHVTVNGGRGVGNVSVEWKGANTNVSEDKNAQKAVRNHAAGVVNSLDKQVDEALKEAAEKERERIRKDASSDKKDDGLK